MQPDQIQPTKVENQPIQAPATPENLPVVEKQIITPVPTEQQSGPTSAVPLAQPAVGQAVPQTAIVSSVQAATTADPSLADLPADDVDTIEKVWIDKTDQIIEQKKDDPQAEDDAQHALSRAYLKKRFNLDVE